MRINYIRNTGFDLILLATFSATANTSDAASRYCRSTRSSLVVGFEGAGNSGARSAAAEEAREAAALTHCEKAL